MAEQKIEEISVSEDVVKFIAWKRMLKTIGEFTNYIVYAHMNHYQPPDPIRYSSYERFYRIAWNTIVLPQIFKYADLLLCVNPSEIEEMLKLGARPEQIHLFPGGIDNSNRFCKYFPDLWFFINYNKIYAFYFFWNYHNIHRFVP